MIHVKLRKIRSTHDNLRTDIVEGYIDALPEVGESVRLFGEPLDPKFNARLIFTTPIKEFQCRTATYMEFKTANSEYALEVLGGQDEDSN